MYLIRVLSRCMWIKRELHGDLLAAALGTRIGWSSRRYIFRWEMSLTDERVNELWLARAKVRYKDWVNLVKSKRPTTGRPKYMDEDTWVQWCNYWDNTKVKEKSAQAKQNRLSEADDPGTGFGRHSGGSRSAVAYSYEMTREQGIPMAQTVVPTFRKLHYNQAEASYTSGKAKCIVEYEAHVADMSQHLPEGVEPTPTDHVGVFVGVAQDPTKHQVFGIGSLYTASPCSVTYVALPSDDSNYLREREEMIKVQEEVVDLRQHLGRLSRTVRRGEEVTGGAHPNIATPDSDS